jgi:hypothetical protein
MKMKTTMELVLGGWVTRYAAYLSLRDILGDVEVVE